MTAHPESIKEERSEREKRYKRRERGEKTICDTEFGKRHNRKVNEESDWPIVFRIALYAFTAAEIRTLRLNGLLCHVREAARVQARGTGGASPCEEDPAILGMTHAQNGFAAPNEDDGPRRGPPRGAASGGPPKGAAEGPPQGRRAKTYVLRRET